MKPIIEVNFILVMLIHSLEQKKIIYYILNSDGIPLTEENNNINVQEKII